MNSEISTSKIDPETAEFISTPGNTSAPTPVALSLHLVAVYYITGFGKMGVYEGLHRPLIVNFPKGEPRKILDTTQPINYTSFEKWDLYMKHLYGDYVPRMFRQLHCLAKGNLMADYGFRKRLVHAMKVIPLNEPEEKVRRSVAHMFPNKKIPEDYEHLIKPMTMDAQIDLMEKIGQDLQALAEVKIEETFQTPIPRVPKVRRDVFTIHRKSQ